jgi:FkbM family methyltransferase
VTDVHANELERVLDVDSVELSRRATELFERESRRPYPSPLVLCGAGRLGRITLQGLRSAGVDVLAFADNNPRLQGQRLDGCEVTSIDEAVSRHGPDAVFITTIYTARPLRRQLEAKGVSVASARSLFFQHPAVFLPHASVNWPESIVGQAPAITEGLGYWADEASKAEYVAQIAWHSLDSLEVPPWVPPEETYFPNGLVELGDHETFVDCGAFDGDTLRAFLQRKGNDFTRLIAFEPDPTNFAVLQSFVAGLPRATRERIEVRPIAVHSRRETLRFSADNGAGSAVSQGGVVEVQADSLDDLLDGITPTFLKMDIEGAEPNAIRGATTILRTSAPKLAVCLYHAREHLWTLPKAIREANPGYDMFLRRHSDECWETVAYGLAH